MTDSGGIQEPDIVLSAHELRSETFPSIGRSSFEGKCVNSPLQT